RRTPKNATIPGLIKVSHTNPTTTPTSDSETILLCQNKKPLNEVGETSVKENRPRRRRANLCGERWSIVARGNLARVPLSKLSPFDCPRHDEPEQNFRRRNEGRARRRNSSARVTKSGVGSQAVAGTVPRGAKRRGARHVPGCVG